VAIEVKVTDRRAAEDFAVCMRKLTEVGPSASGSFWTICRRTSPARSNRPFPLATRDGAAPIGVPPSLPARQLAEHRRDRDWCATAANVSTGVAPPMSSSCPKSAPDNDSAMPQHNWVFTIEKARAKMGRAYPEPLPSASPKPKSHNRCAAVPGEPGAALRVLLAVGATGDHRATALALQITPLPSL
jgi:hypothetical protein